MNEKENISQDIAGKGVLLTIGNESPVADNTTIMLYMVRMAALEDHTPTAYFSPGLSKVEVVNRLLSVVTGIDRSHIETGTLSDEQWIQLDSKLPLLMGAPLYIDDTPEIELDDLNRKVKKLAKENGVRLVVVNPVSMMTVANQPFADARQRIDYITTSLKAIAEELGITVFAVEK